MREDDSADAPVARRRGIAMILAAGLLRHCRVVRKSLTSCDKESSDSAQNCLEPVRNTRLTVPAGSGGYGPRDPEKGQRT
jgi:hypothetical protein